MPGRSWYVFGPFRFDGTLLFRGDEHIDIGGDAQRPVLKLLLANAGRLVARPDLYALWAPGTHPTMVDRAISALRTSLGDRVQGRNRQYEYIATRVGEGYIFVKSVRVEREEPPREVSRLYYEGYEWWNDREPKAMERAIECFHGALEHDRAYAPALAALADCYATQGAYSWRPPSQAAELAKAQARAALNFDDQLAQPYATLGFVHSRFERQWAEAERHFRRALELAPNYATARHWYALHLAATGRLGEALDMIREVDPRSRTIQVHLATMLYWDGEYAAALDKLSEVDTIHRNSWYAAYTRGLVYEQQGQFEQASRAQVRAQKYFGHRSPFLIAALARARALCGAREEALCLLEHAHPLNATEGTVSFHVGVAHAALGDNDAAFRFLEDACARQEVWVSFALVDPRMVPLRKDPRYAQLLAKLNLTHLS
jgi:tetratricopeptide (TPR) repeat protein